MVARTQETGVLSETRFFVLLHFYIPDFDRPGTGAKQQHDAYASFLQAVRYIPAYVDVQGVEKNDGHVQMIDGRVIARDQVGNNRILTQEDIRKAYPIKPRA